MGKTLFKDPLGPIEKFEWGKFIIDGEKHFTSALKKKGAGKDIRIVGEKVSAWKERKGHQLTFEMIAGVLDKDIDILVLGVGVNGAIECSEEVIENIKAHGIHDVFVLTTPDACKKFNQLYRKGERVALLAHGTC